MDLPKTTTFRDHLLSIYQSAVQHLAERQVDPGHAAALVGAAATVAAERGDGAPIALAPPPSSFGDVWTCARLGLDYLGARLVGDAAGADRLRSELVGSPCDPGWVRTLEEHFAYFGPNGTRAVIPYVHAADVGDRVISMPPGQRIGLISDWGTGTPAAEMLLRQVAALRPDILIHLGDIYYSGTPRECERDFLQVIERVLGPVGARIPVFTLSGNHDMYSGGHGYYGLVARLNAAPFVQGASFFCLRDRLGGWQILGMDTGLNDHDPAAEFTRYSDTFLDASEEAWHAARVREFAGRTILLSHHPLFSAFRRIGAVNAAGQLEPVNEALAGSLRRFQAAGDVAAWFWGHEHNLCVYQPYAGLARGRCIGSGAIPVFVRDGPYRPLAGLVDPPLLVLGTQLGEDGPVMKHGFAMLHLSAGGATAAYYEAGRELPLYAETLDGATGVGSPAVV